MSAPLKRYGILLLLLLQNLCPEAKAQTLSTAQLIEAWETSDSTQTRKAEATCEDLAHHKNEPVFQQRVKELNAYLKEHPSQRLKTRITFYILVGTSAPGDSLLAACKTALDEGLKYADLENDQQLLSEIYSFYPIVEPKGTTSFYTFKSIEMQEKMGAHLFPMLYLRYLNISTDLYVSGAYREALNYVKRGLQLITAYSSGDRDRLLLLDYAAASYLKLGIADSALLYFKKMQASRPVVARYRDSAYLALWEGITVTGIGRCLVNQQKYTDALPFLQQGLAANRHFRLYGSIGDVHYGFARIDTAFSKYDSALYHWRTAYHFYSLAADTIDMAAALKSMATVYLKKKQYDSAYFYNNRYHIVAQSLEKTRRINWLSSLQSRMNFENAVSSLARAKDTIRFYERLRTISIVTVLLLLMLIGLLYNRYRLKRLYRQKQLEQKNQMAEIEVANAKKQVAAFAKNIIEKDGLISELQEKLALARPCSNGLPEDYFVHHVLITDAEWEQFRAEFKKAYPAFFPALQKKLGSVTPAEERLAALICSGLTNQQIAGTLGIAKQSVTRAKRRLKLRLKLDEEVSLEEYVLSLEK